MSARPVPGRDEYVEDLAAFVAASPSSYHAAAEVARRLDGAGFARLDEVAAWTPVDGAARSYVVRDGAVIAWLVPDGAGPTSAYRIVGAHTDSPNLRVKPYPDSGASGWRQVGRASCRERVLLGV